MSHQEPNIGLNYGWRLGESGWNLQMDENLKAIGALLLVSVLSATDTTPQESLSPGDRYLVPASGVTGAWSGHEKKIVRWSGSAWEVFNPQSGWEVTAQDTAQRYHYDGTSWALLHTRLGKYMNDTLAANGGVPIGGVYTNPLTGTLHVRLR